MFYLVTIQNGRSSSQRTFTQIVLRWPTDKTVPKVKDMLGVLDMMDSNQKTASQKGPAIIMCR